MLKEIELKFKLWQLVFYELGLFALGILVGAYWAGFFTNFLELLALIAVLCLVYITVISIRQIKSKK